VTRRAGGRPALDARGVGRIVARAVLPAVVVVASVPARAQVGPRRPTAPRRPFVAEARLDAVGVGPTLLAGAGVFTDAGLYGRVGATAGLGVETGGPARAVAEAAVVGRFVLDPLRQARVGVYAGAGLGARVVAGATRGFLLGVAGLEGRARGGVAPAVEVGIGGGVRVTAVLRRARPARR
jgi:hypothetical protein